MMLPKVLVGVCTYEGKDYIWPEFKKGVENLTYPNFDVMIVDNSKGNAYSRKLKKDCKENGFMVKHITRAKNSRIAHADSLNTIRDYFLDNDYEYMLLLESDILPPVDIIQRQIATGKSVVGAIYFIGHAWDPKRAPKACLFDNVDGKSTRILTREEGWSMYGKGVQPIHGCGIGCTLVHKNVIEQFKFWWHLSNPPKHADVLFFADLENNNIPVYVNTDVVVRHQPSDWDKVKDI